MPKRADSKEDSVRPPPAWELRCSFTGSLAGVGIVTLALYAAFAELDDHVRLLALPVGNSSWRPADIMTDHHGRCKHGEAGPTCSVPPNL
jgi:hypothetical protein